MENTGVAAVESDPIDIPSGGLRGLKREFLEWLHSPVNRSLLLFKFFYFLFYAAFGSLFPLLSIYFKQLGFNATQCGALGGLRSLVEWIGAPFWSGIAERWKKGKFFLMASLFCWICFTLGLGFVRPKPEGCLVRLNSKFTEESANDSAYRNLFIFEPYRQVPSESVESVEMQRYLALAWRNQIGQSPLHLNSEKLSDKADIAMLTLDKAGLNSRVTSFLNNPYHDPQHYPVGSLLMPLYSTVVYTQSKINQVFTISMILMAFGAFFSSPAICLADSAVMLFLEGQGTNLYGRQRMFGSVGWGLAMFFVGIALDQAQSFPDHPCLRPGHRERNYMVCFAVFTVFMSCALLVATQFQFPYDGAKESMYFKVMKDKVTKTLLRRTAKSRGKLVNEDDGGEDWRGDGQGYMYLDAEQSGTTAATTTNEDILEQQLGIRLDRADIHHSQMAGLPASDPFVEDLAATAQTKITQWLTVLKYFTNPRLATFLFVTWFMGLGSGIVFTFLFWHLQELGGSPTLYGIASIINYLSEIVAYYFSYPAIKRFGHIKVLYFGLLINVLRFLYISWIGNPWWVLPFEFVHGLTHAGIWAACCSYVAQCFEPQYRISTQGVLQGINHGLGKGVGALIGGPIISAFGSANLFRAYGAASAFILLGFLAMNYFVPEVINQETKPDQDAAANGMGNTSTPGQPTKTTSGGETTSFLDETTYLAPSGTPFIPASRTMSASRMNELARGTGDGGQFSAQRIP
uniref:Major facilitator superfamily associated domain-containing protein n=1 Tax=Schistocephalus solidus TaxID=70667 RepID=A0A0V0J5I9_SCHSO